MPHVLVREVAALALVALAEGALVEGHRPPLGAIQLRLREAVLTDPPGFDRDRREPASEPAVRDLRHQRERVHPPAEAVVPCARAEKRRIRLPLKLGKALVEHVHEEPLDDVAPVVAHQRVAVARALPDQLHARARQLGIRGHAEPQILVERHRAVGLRRGRASRLDRLEELLQKRLDLRRVDVADGHERHLPGPVPGVVEGAQPFGRRRAQDVRFANRHPLRVPRLVEEDGQLLVADARPRAEAPAPLFDDDPALLVDLVRIQRQAAGEVGERRQPAQEDVVGIGRQLQHVDRFLEAGIRVHVGTQARSGPLEVRHQLARLEVGAAVERHVLQEVRQSLLIVGFVKRARLDRQAQRDALRRPWVLPDEKLQPVAQRSTADAGVEGEALRQVERTRARSGWHRLLPGDHAGRRRE